MGNLSNRPTQPADNILRYIKAKITYNHITGELFGPSGKVYTNRMKQGYIQIDLTRLENGRFLKGHHIAWFLYYGFWPSEQLDHDNRKRDDNRILNLYKSDGHAQATNRISSDNREYPVGVYFEYGKFVAKATINGKTTYLGRYATAEQASEVYQQAIKINGDHHFAP